MPTAKLEIGVWRDTLEARDVAIMTPHFKTVGPFTSWESLCQDLATAIDNWQASRSQVRVRAYDDESPPPNAPLAEAYSSKGVAGTSAQNRDVALVLSFSGGSGQPSQRGRLYAPVYLTGLGPNTPVASGTMLAKVGALVPILTGLGGVNVDWVVWSQKLRSSVPVERWHVDNAWDTQRRRGMESTARIEGTTSEADAPSMRSLVRPQPDLDLGELDDAA